MCLFSTEHIIVVVLSACFCFPWKQHHQQHYLFLPVAALTPVDLSNQRPTSLFLPNSSSRRNGGNSNGGTGITRIPIAGRYNNMTISSLGCGTWSWGNRLLYNYNEKDDMELHESYKIVRTAGVTIFDTADSYGTFNYNGRAEILLGQFERMYQNEKESIGEQQQKQNVLSSFLSSYFVGSSSTRGGESFVRRNNENNDIRQVATKLAPYPWRIRRQSIVAACEGSLRRIQESKVAIAQVHWSTANYQPFQERTLWEGLGDLYDLNYCDAIGVSNYGPNQLLKIINYMKNERTNQKEKNPIPIATAQIQYSLLTYADPITQNMNSVCNANNVQLIAYSPLCLGLLSGKYTVDNINSMVQSIPRRQLFRELLPGSTKLLQTLNAIAIERGKTMSQVAINWTVCKGTIPIPGCRTPIQAQQTIDSVCGWRLQQSEMDELDRVALAITKPMIQNIFQTK